MVCGVSRAVGSSHTTERITTPRLTIFHFSITATNIYIYSILFWRSYKSLGLCCCTCRQQWLWRLWVCIRYKINHKATSLKPKSEKLTCVWYVWYVAAAWLVLMLIGPNCRYGLVYYVLSCSMQSSEWQDEWSCVTGIMPKLLNKLCMAVSHDRKNAEGIPVTMWFIVDFISDAICWFCDSIRIAAIVSEVNLGNTRS